jgi:hypothetical protein
VPRESGKPKKPPPGQRVEPLKIELEFEDALRAALEVPPKKTDTPKRKTQGKN